MAQIYTGKAPQKIIAADLPGQDKCPAMSVLHLHTPDVCRLVDRLLYYATAPRPCRDSLPYERLESSAVLRRSLHTPCRMHLLLLPEEMRPGWP